jgi:hypothetical protein
VRGTDRKSPRADIQQLLLAVSIDSWRLARLFGKAVAKLDAGEAQRYVNQIRYHFKTIEETLEAVGFKLVTIEGQSYDPGIAATAVNVGDFAPDDLLVVDQMVEPIVMGIDGLVKSGVVTLKRVDK